jgi:hypothetical protein
MEDIMPERLPASLIEAAPAEAPSAPPGAPAAGSKPRPAVPARGTPRRRAQALLAAAQAGPGDRVLILGARGAPDLLCAALARGCLSATSLNLAPSRPEPSDVVLLPATPDGLPALLACARRALQGCARGGRLALQLIGSSAQARVTALTETLTRLGFEKVRLRHGPGGEDLLVCRLPQPARPA